MASDPQKQTQEDPKPDQATQEPYSLVRYKLNQKLDDFKVFKKIIVEKPET